MVALSMLLSSSVVLAQQSPDILAKASQSSDGDVPSVFDTVLSRADGAHEYVSTGLEATAKSLDGFFAEDSAFEEATNTYLRLNFDSVFKEYEGMGFAGDARLKVDLPNTKKRLKLLIESDAQRGDTEGLEESPEQVAQNRDYSVAIERVVPGMVEKWNIRPSLGIKVRAPLDPFIRLRSHRYFEYTNWLLRFASGVSWFDSRGYDAYLSLSFDRPLNDVFTFRYGPQLSWTEEDMFRRLGQGISLYQQIDERQKIAYQIGSEADDDWDGEWRAKRYDIQIRYRRNLYKKWLFGEIIPHWQYLKETGFRVEPSLTFRLELVFGERYR